ncbi:MAG: hypothetical protein LBB63_02580, partial [Holosporaceae bacterium]|nr:hypothetical protein [Holosporaceae bacterium]
MKKLILGATLAALLGSSVLGMEDDVAKAKAKLIATQEVNTLGKVYPALWKVFFTHLEELNSSLAKISKIVIKHIGNTPAQAVIIEDSKAAFDNVRNALKMLLKLRDDTKNSTDKTFITNFRGSLVTNSRNVAIHVNLLKDRCGAVPLNGTVMADLFRNKMSASALKTYFADIGNLRRATEVLHPGELREFYDQLEHMYEVLAQLCSYEVHDIVPVTYGGEHGARGVDSPYSLVVSSATINNGEYKRIPRSIADVKPLQNVLQAAPPPPSPPPLNVQQPVVQQQQPVVQRQQPVVQQQLQVQRQVPPLPDVNALRQISGIQTLSLQNAWRANEGLKKFCLEVNNTLDTMKDIYITATQETITAVTGKNAGSVFSTPGIALAWRTAQIDTLVGKLDRLTTLREFVQANCVDGMNWYNQVNAGLESLIALLRAGPTKTKEVPVLDLRTGD